MSILNPFNRHPRADLSAYVDGELASNRAGALEAHLTTCESCGAELAALRELQSHLNALPAAESPRSFALTPDMARRPVVALPPVRVSQPSRVAAFSSGLRLAGGGMAAGLAIVMVIAVAGSGGGDGGDDSAPAVAEMLNATSLSSAYDGTDDSDFDSRNAQGDAGALDSLTVPTPTPEVKPATGEGGGTSQPQDGDASTPEPPELAATSGPNSLGGPAPGSVEEDSDEAPAPTDPQTLDIDADDLANPNAEREGFSDTVPATTSDDGPDILLIVAIVLVAGAVLAFGGSALLSRIARDDA